MEFETSASTPSEVCGIFQDEMKVADQIAVKHKGHWYNATIVGMGSNHSGTYFKVRYNPKDNANGKDPFA